MSAGQPPQYQGNYAPPSYDSGYQPSYQPGYQPTPQPYHMPPASSVPQHMHTHEPAYTAPPMMASPYHDSYQSDSPSPSREEEEHYHYSSYDQDAGRFECLLGACLGLFISFWAVICVICVDSDKRKNYMTGCLIACIINFILLALLSLIGVE